MHAQHPSPPTFPADFDAWLDRVLAEDIGAGDATTEALVPPGAAAAARIVARTPCIVAGIPIARRLFARLDPEVRFTAGRSDGDAAGAGETVLRIEGHARAILTGERTALNLLQRLGGIATLTRRFVETAGPGVQVLDTRKTTPGLRWMEKYAVRCGGGANHRAGLYDRILIKDNHRAFWTRGDAVPLADAVRAARARHPGLPIEIEVESEAELDDALEGGPDWVLLDNMPTDRLRRCVVRTAGHARLEASGGVTLETVATIAATGVDAVSVGALTHSAPSVDLSLEFEGATPCPSDPATPAGM